MITKRVSAVKAFIPLKIYKYGIIRSIRRYNKQILSDIAKIDRRMEWIEQLRIENREHLKRFEG